MKYADGGVGAYVKELLGEVVSTNDDGFPVGHSYKRIMEMALEKFPQSAVDQKHIGWYCTKMRERGEDAPVYRERSRWKEVK